MKMENCRDCDELDQKNSDCQKRDRHNPNPNFITVVYIIFRILDSPNYQLFRKSLGPTFFDNGSCVPNIRVVSVTVTVRLLTSVSYFLVYPLKWVIRTTTTYSKDGNTVTSHGSMYRNDSTFTQPFISGTDSSVNRVEYDTSSSHLVTTSQFNW